MIKENLTKIKSKIPENVTLVAVSKTKPTQFISEAYNCGHRDFGENKVQELVEKAELLPKDIQWHMIGHLQRNKVKYIAPFIALIHGVDSFKLLKEVNKQAKKNERKIDILLQFHIAKEDSKFGFSYEEVSEMLNDENFIQLSSVNIRGVMGMATLTKNKNQITEEFKTLKNYFLRLQSSYFEHNNDFNIISMGMSGDYRIAIEEGSNMIRVGSAIFGER